MSQNTVNGLAPVKSKKKGVIAATAAAATFALANTGAHAAMDVTEVTTGLTAQVANIETIGIAILGVLVVIAGLSMLRRIVRQLEFFLQSQLAQVSQFNKTNLPEFCTMSDAHVINWLIVFTFVTAIRIMLSKI